MIRLFCMNIQNFMLVFPIYFVHLKRFIIQLKIDRIWQNYF